MVCRGKLELFDLNSNATREYLEVIGEFSMSYSSKHKYIVLPLCFLGSLMNILHIIVLTRPKMKSICVNQLISLIAICDILTMTSYAVYTTRFNLFHDYTEVYQGYPLFWAIFAILHGVLSVALHAITLFLWVATAYVRYRTIRNVDKGDLNNPLNIFYLYLTCVLGVLIFCIPSFLMHEIVKNPQTSLYSIEVSRLTIMNSCFLFKLNLWVNGILFKAFPTMLLVIFTCALLVELKMKNKRRELLFSENRRRSKKIKSRADKMTMMLIILLSVFASTELPQGFLAILNGLYPNDVHHLIYENFGELLDLLSLINCNTCFVIYIIMSSEYRKTLNSFIGILYKRSQPVINHIYEKTRTRASLDSMKPCDDVIYV